MGYAAPTMSQIESIRAREILDSRGNPTIEVEMRMEGGEVVARAAVPSGASTGGREAYELRDGDAERFSGRGVLKAKANVEQVLAPILVGREVDRKLLVEFDGEMRALDGTEDKSVLGANGILGVSLCLARLGAEQQRRPLFEYLRHELMAPTNPVQQQAATSATYTMPAPMMNIINGGCHAANNLDIQEFMIVPHLDRPFRENLRAAVEVFQGLRQLLAERGYSTNVGDEGGFAPHLESHQQALDLILMAIERAHYRPGEDFSLALDCAANEYYREDAGHYLLEGRPYSSQEKLAYLESLIARYPIYSIEDGMAEQDHRGWQQLTQGLGDRVLLIGDDLFATNCQILRQGIADGKANGILIKVNQIGTLSETFAAMALAWQHHYQVVISHRSGETADSFIADLAVASSCGHIKAGSASRSDRVEKYNQLLRIEEFLGAERAPYHRVRK